MNLSARQVIYFIENNLVHTEGPWAGQPFILLPYQRDVVHDIYDDRDENGRRRCTKYYLETGKGCGKSPFLAALAIVEFLFSGPGALVVSLAATYTQAYETTFVAARNLILASPTLRRIVEVQERQLKGPGSSRWIVQSGDAAGKAGPRCTCAIIDELQQQRDRKLLDQTEANQLKLAIRQPLLLVAGNAGNPGTIAAEWHERGKKYMAGENTGSFKARIYGLDRDDDWTDETLWSKANPALEHIITLDALRSECEIARTDPAVEHRFRSLHLGQWLGQTQTGFLDMAAWEKCSKLLPSAEELAQLPCWISFDLSSVDDLTAVAVEWVGPDRTIYVRNHHWMPRPTAEKYDQTIDTKYQGEWSRFVTLTNTITIDHTVKEDVAKFIETVAKANKVQQVCFDSWRASDIVGYLERVGLICEPIPPTFAGVSEATKELDRRTREGSIIIEPNPLLDVQAQNLHVITDSNGNVRYTKYNAKGRYAGVRSQKIDGIAAIVLGLTRSMRHANALVEKRKDMTGAILYMDDV